MMKKVLSLVLALVIVFALAATGVAASNAISRAKLSAGSSIVEVGDTVTITITMDEAISLEDDTTMIQLELNYDQDLLSYVSSKLGADYDFLTVVASKREPVIKINWIDINAYDVNEIDSSDKDASRPDRLPKELPAGTIVTVSFTVKETTEKAVIISSLEDSFAASGDGDLTYTFDSSVSITVCTGHVDEAGDGVCDICNGELNKTLPGDVNGDGKVNNVDAMLAMQYYVGKITADGLDLDASDVNGDGKVNNVDAMLIMQYYVGKITEFPVN